MECSFWRMLIDLWGQLYSHPCFSPQNTNEAIAHLCKITSSTHLICHPTLYSQAYRALGTDSATCIAEICPREAWQNVRSNRPLIEVTLSPSDEADMTALIMHTSGSTGMPKVLSLLFSILLSPGELRCLLAHLPSTQDLDRSYTMYPMEASVHYNTFVPRE